MKPRLVSLPLTSEDVMIWRRWRRHSGDPWYGRLRIEYGAADIRDAELMLRLTRVQGREAEDEATWVQHGPDGRFCRVRPAALFVVERDITYFA